MGLYDPRFEHDACGIGLICHIKGRKSHDIIRDGLKILENLTHRGACGCDETTGDGAGILMQMPHEFLRTCCHELDIRLPAEDHYGCGLVFLPRVADQRQQLMNRFEAVVREEGQIFLGWRKVPVDSTALGNLARNQEPVIYQIFIGRSPAYRRHGPLRTQTVHHPQGYGRFRPAGESGPGDLFSRPKPFLPDIGLQGHASGGPDDSLLSRPEPNGNGQRSGLGPPALQHQYVSDLGPGPSFPLHMPQRRNQYPQGQCQLAQCSPGPVQIGSFRR